jgi:hypothetical protein
MLYASLALGLASAGPIPMGPAACLLLAVTGLYLARHVAGLMLRRRGSAGLVPWLAAYLAAGAAGGLPLVLGGYRNLAWLGLLAGGVFLLFTLLSRRPNRRRWDRTLWGEVSGIGALALTAPAGRVVSAGALDGTGWFLWALCVLFFSSSVFYVKMRIAALRYKRAFGARERWEAGRPHLAYHALLAALAAGMAIFWGDRGGILLLAAFAPILLRAFVGWRALSNTVPAFKLLGMLEAVYSIWFAVLVLHFLNA